MWLHTDRLTPAQLRAEIRHENRTEVEVQAIKDAWAKRQHAIEQMRTEIKLIKETADKALTFALSSTDTRLKSLASEFKKYISNPLLSIEDIRKSAKRLQNRYNKVLGAMKQNDVDTPPTLVNLDKAIRDFKGLDPELVKKEAYLNAKMKKLFEDNDFGLDIKHEYLESVLERGFLNTFQTGTSDGYEGSAKTSGLIETSHERLATSHKLYGNYTSLSRDFKNGEYYGKQLKREEYEKYGHLLDRDKKNAIQHNYTQYGDVQVRFKKDKVKTTWTFDDSLCQVYQPTLTSDPKVHSFDKSYAARRIDDTNSWNSLYKWQEETCTEYIELQYHGTVTADCIESLTFPDFPVRLIKKNVLNRYRSMKVKIFYYDKATNTVKRY